jgi:hypothetical protein
MPRTPVLTVREDGGFNCDGPGCCGGSSYGGLKAIEKCFHCSLCGAADDSRSHRFSNGRKPKVVDNRGAVSLGMWC